MGLEPMTSPLPRECSTTELHQPYCYSTAPEAVSAQLETQKSPATTKSPAASCPAPSSATQVPQALQSQPAPQPAAHCPREPYPSQPSLILQLQKNGAQGRIRTFVATSAADLQSAAINHSATCAHPACLPATPFSRHIPYAVNRRVKRARPLLRFVLADTAGQVQQADTTKLYCLLPVKTGAGEGI